MYRVIRFLYEGGRHIADGSFDTDGKNGLCGRIVRDGQGQRIVVAAIRRAVTRGKPGMEVVNIGHIV